MIITKITFCMSFCGGGRNLSGRDRVPSEFDIMTKRSVEAPIKVSRSFG